MFSRTFDKCVGVTCDSLYDKAVGSSGVGFMVLCLTKVNADNAGPARTARVAYNAFFAMSRSDASARVRIPSTCGPNTVRTAPLTMGCGGM